MSFVADLHSHFSRATAKNCDLPHLELWARRKGVALVGTGDFTHPAWLDEIRDQLVPEGDGLLRLVSDRALASPDGLPAPEAEVRFILSAEISSIYKQGGRTRKVHSLILMPDIEAVGRFNDRLGRLGNLTSDGRPILGLSAKDLLSLTLDADPRALYVPAHAWTPWFSILGSKGGFDSIEECFEDLTPHIHAIETGLSSDPPMNWRLSALDHLTLVSNSDAHSPGKLAREANLFDSEMTYHAVIGAIKTRNGFGGTIEFFPEEGKYHLDGHRKCGLRLEPAESVALEGRCPECGRPLTLGVQHRVEDLADRAPGFRPPGAPPFHSLLSLPQILGQVLGFGPGTKRVAALYGTLLERLGPELEILLHLPPSIISVAAGESGPLLARAIDNMRQGKVQTLAGFDGEFGTITVLDDEDRRQVSGQEQMWAFEPPPEAPRPGPTAPRTATRVAESPSPPAAEAPPRPGPDLDEPSAGILTGLNEPQQRAVTAPPGPLVIIAGPGTGKTLTLSRRAAHLIAQQGAAGLAAVTFTRQAAHELQRRIRDFLPDGDARVLACTFHSLGAEILRMAGRQVTVLDEEEGASMLRKAAREVSGGPKELGRRISDLKQRLIRPQDVDESAEPDLCRGYRRYQELLDQRQALDFDDLIFRPIRALEADPELLERCQGQWPHLLVDEFQDINAAQWRLVRLIAPGETPSLTVIGDPHQAIYGFRGASAEFFQTFQEQIPAAAVVGLDRSYRCPATVLDASRQVIVAGDGTAPRELTSLAEGRQTITIAGLPSDKAEAVYVSRKIEQIIGGMSFFHHDAGLDDHAAEVPDLGLADVAVLFRTHAQAEPVQEALDRAGVPYQTAADRDLGLTDDLDFTADKVSLLTLHAAKGLEWPVVIIIGCEANLIPYQLPTGSPASIEEERRLFYVGLTRARYALFLTHAAKRRRRGRLTIQKPSPFLDDIERRLLEADRPVLRPKPGAARQLDMF